jgi:hypothetical protein
MNWSKVRYAPGSAYVNHTIWAQILILFVYSDFWIHDEKAPSSKSGVILGSIIGFLQACLCCSDTEANARGKATKASCFLVRTEETAEFIDNLGIALRRQPVLRQRNNLVATVDADDFGNFSSNMTPDGVAAYLNRFQNQVTCHGGDLDHVSDADLDIQEHENADVVTATGALSSRAPESTQLNDAVSVTSSMQM